MRAEQYTLDYIAENDLRDDESWEAARHLGRQVVRYMRADGISSGERNYYIDDIDVEERLFSVSEQPDLSGPIIVNLYKGEGKWSTSRPPGPSYHDLYNLPMRSGPYLGLAARHHATSETLLQVMLPLTPMTGHLLRNGYCASYSEGVAQRGIAERYNSNDLAFEPRRVQVAAYIARYVIEHKLSDVDMFYATPEEKLAWLEKNMPYQDLPLTGGGGKTVRRRHIHDGKRRTYTLEELHAMRRPRAKPRKRDE